MSKSAKPRAIMKPASQAGVWTVSVSRPILSCPARAARRAASSRRPWRLMRRASLQAIPMAENAAPMEVMLGRMRTRAAPNAVMISDPMP